MNSDPSILDSYLRQVATEPFVEIPASIIEYLESECDAAEAWGNAGEVVYINPQLFLKDISQSDIEELADEFDEDENENLTTGELLRKALLREFEDSCSDYACCKHAFRVKNSEGQEWYICGSSVCMGQGGLEFSWDGCFKSPRDYIHYLESSGYKTENQILEISEEKLESIWPEARNMTLNPLRK